MKVFACVLALALSVSALPKFSNEFEAFEAKFEKNYNNPMERLSRFLIFEKNLREIEQFNSENHGWKKSVNQFSDLSEDEFKSRYVYNVLHNHVRMLQFSKSKMSFKIVNFNFWQKRRSNPNSPTSLMILANLADRYLSLGSLLKRGETR